MATATTSNGPDKMVSFPTLDLLLLTYNCAKVPIHVPDFANHLQRAISDNATAVNTLPDLVVFSLQEVAPLGHAFAGSYFLSPYFSRFEEALEQAASQIDGYQIEDTAPDSNDNDDDDDDTNDETARLQPAASTQTKAEDTKKHYHLVRQEHVGMTAIIMFARNLSAVEDVQVAHCGFGVSDMGNKGAVGVRIAYKESELTFVATHLAAMEWNKGRRNANWRSIVAGLTFGNPQDVITAAASSAAAAALGRGHLGRSNDEAASAPRTPEEEAEAEAAHAAGDDAWLLMGEQQHEADVRRQLQDMSIFRSDSLLFVAGDLNYRIGDERPSPDAVFPTASTWPDFLQRDQLTQERLAGRTFHGMQEAAITFPPTYKYDLLSVEDIAEGAVPANIDEIKAWKAARDRGEEDAKSAEPVPWKYASHRWPSWCDRVLYLDVPEWHGHEAKIGVTAYKSLPLMASSDHQPVYFRANVPLLGKNPARVAEEPLASSSRDIPSTEPAADGVVERSAPIIDPRLRLPVAIDTDAWARRMRARNKERLAGGGMLLFNTRAGAASMLTLLVLLASLYWAWAGWA